jgi:hypothetical protein
MLDVLVPEVSLQRPLSFPALARANPQAILSPAASVARSISFWKFDTVIGLPRSDTNMKGDFGLAVQPA